MTAAASDTPRSTQYSPNSTAWSSDPGADQSARPLLAALAAYFTETRSRDDVRTAISRWCRDEDQMGIEPQVLVVQFKLLLNALAPDQQSADFEQRMHDRREMISMCIEEFYRPID